MRQLFVLFTGLLLAQAGLSAKADIAKLPYAGLLIGKVKVQGVAISEFAFENGEKKIEREPGEEVACTFRYTLSADELPTLERHHLVLGIYKEGPQECALSTFGINDSEGVEEVTLRAPTERGIYQVRVAMAPGLTCEGAKEAWDEKNSSRTVVGIIIVR